jgi:hypothetical protein
MYRSKEIKRVDNWNQLQTEIDTKLDREVQSEFAAYFKWVLETFPKQKR